MRASKWSLAVGVPFVFVAALFARRGPGHLLSNVLNGRHTTAPPRVPATPRTPPQVVTPDYMPIIPTPTVASSVARCATIEPTTDPRDALGIRVREERSRNGADPQLSYGDNARVWLRVQGVNAPMAPTTGPDALLRLSLTAPSTLSTRAPIALTLTAENAGSAPFAILRTNDGSFERMREPHAELYLQRVSDSAVYRLSSVGARCGMMNSIEAADVVAIDPSASTSAAFAHWAGHLVQTTIPVAGRYKLWVMYRLCDRARMGQLSDGVTLPANLLSDRVVSNAVDIEVR